MGGIWAYQHYTGKVNGHTVYEYLWGASYASTDGYRNIAKVTEGIATMGGAACWSGQAETLPHRSGPLARATWASTRAETLTDGFSSRQGKAISTPWEISGRKKIMISGQTTATTVDQTVELFDAQMNLSAQGNVSIGAIVNPMIVDVLSNGLPAFSNAKNWDLEYTKDTSISVRAVTGDVTLTGKDTFRTANVHVLSGGDLARLHVPPSTVKMYAGRDILLAPGLYTAAGGSEFSMVPSQNGTLVLDAGRDINGGYAQSTDYRASILVSDMDPAAVYGIQLPRPTTSNNGITADITNNLFDPTQHAANPLHSGDSVPVSITAGRDITGLRLFLPKQADVNAGRDINDLYYYGQNVGATDVTLIKAGRDLVFSFATVSDASGNPAKNTGIILGGPGALLVQAGNNIDLGKTQGIQTVGSQFDSALGSKGADLVVAAGVSSDLAADRMQSFFQQLKAAGQSTQT